MPDADLPRAAEMIAAAAYFNAGQDCTAATRVIVHSSVHDELVDLLVKAAEGTRPGPPSDEEAEYGPLNNASHLAKVEAFLAELPDHATVRTGGSRHGEAGFFFAPTVVTGVRQDDRIVQEEVFGPVLTVQSFDDEAEAVAMANGVPYGLAASVWTRDHRRRRPAHPRARLRVRVGQHPHPVRLRDAARRLRRLRLRQGPVGLRLRRLHAHQARDDRALLGGCSSGTPTSNTSSSWARVR